MLSEVEDNQMALHFFSFFRYSNKLLKSDKRNFNLFNSFRNSIRLCNVIRYDNIQKFKVIVTWRVETHAKYNSVRAIFFIVFLIFIKITFSKRSKKSTKCPSNSYYAKERYFNLFLL